MGYEHLSNDELIEIIKKQNEELKRKKYGLVWETERENEKVVLDCAHHLPILKCVNERTISTDTSEDNILIEGDNYHALSVLSYTHKEKIDLIYIDPPYNTGNKDFIYNDRYVDKEDKYRHSKWLNFMEKRLNLAKDLLKNTGVLFISIDDNEMAQLKLLCDRVFGEENFVANAIWEKKFSPQNDAKWFSDNHDYILIYAKSKDLWRPIKLQKSDEANARYKNLDNDLRGLWTSSDLTVKTYSASYDYEIITPAGKAIKPTNGRCWMTSKENMQKLINDNRVWFGKNGSNTPRLKKFLSEVSETIVPMTIWHHKEVGHNQEAKQELKKIVEELSFNTPKPTRLLKRIIELSTSKNSAPIILDFFAGSGTTGHAVLDLNAIDGGNRRFILCTNNENGICENVTYPRLQKVIHGYAKHGNGETVEGLGGNLRYFRTSLLKKSKSPKSLKKQLTRECVEMLCVKENIYNLQKETKEYKIFLSNDANRSLCVYFDTTNKGFNDFIDELKTIEISKAVYVFSNSLHIDQKLFVGVKNFTIEAIPQKILDVYKRLVKLNIPLNPEMLFLDFEKAKRRVFDEKDKDDGARLLRVILEKTIEKIASSFGVNITEFSELSRLNDHLKQREILSKVIWEENKTYIAIGNHATHGDHDEYDQKQVENFYRHIQNLIDTFIG